MKNRTEGRGGEPLYQDIEEKNLAREKTGFPVVGIGGSAGSLPAFKCRQLHQIKTAISLFILRGCILNHSLVASTDSSRLYWLP